MCCHRFYIYSVCGHSLFAASPLVACPKASAPSKGPYATATCQPTAHPFQSWKVGALCPDCQERRARLLANIDVDLTLKYEEWRWKVSYGMPSHGKDFWGRKADERARLEKETGKRKRKSLPFRWKRTLKSRRGQIEIMPEEGIRCAPALLDKSRNG